jgi:hypothetical protein
MTTITWEPTFDAALSRADKEAKLVLLDFSAAPA